MGLCFSDSAGEPYQSAGQKSPMAAAADAMNCVLLGSAGVGKTNFCLHRVENRFKREYTPSEGMDLYTLEAEPRPVRIFCNAGMARVTIGTAYFKSASCFVLMYDVCDIRSFRECQNQLNQVTTHGPPERPPVFMIGNKTDIYEDPAWKTEPQWDVDHFGECPENADLNPAHVMARVKTTERSRQVTTEQAQEFCDQNGIQFFEISVIKGIGVDEIYDKLFKLAT